MPDNLLHLNGAGQFRILCISDIHAGIGYNEALTAAYLKILLKKTNPDLVLMLGDIAGPGEIHIENTVQLRKMLTSLTAPIENKKIPWASVFGNHDDNFGVSNEEAQKIYGEFPLCLSKAGPEEFRGSGTYTLTVFDRNGTKPVFNIYAFDSHGSDLNPKRGVDFNQVKWYYSVSEKLEKEQNRVLPALAVMHIPLTEMGEASLSPEENGLTGEFGEKVSCNSLNNGLFRACLERGDIKYFCFGHDHSNNFTLNYKGISLSFDGYLSAHACHNVRQLGGRLYELSENLDGTVSVRHKFVPVLLRK